MGVANNASTAVVAGCDGIADDTPAFLGVAWSPQLPGECHDNPPFDPKSMVAVSPRSVVGPWLDCNGSFLVGNQVASGIEFTADGRYNLLVQRDTFSLVRAGSDAGADADAAGVAGTFALADGSGTVELDLYPVAGGMVKGQLAVEGVPLGQQLLVTLPPGTTFGTASADDAGAPFVHPIPWSARAGICSCQRAVARKVDPSDASALSAALTGRWLWCGGPEEWPIDSNSPSDGIPMGIEFPGDATWFLLVSDAAGNLKRSGADSDRGAIEWVQTPTEPPLNLILVPVSNEVAPATFQVIVTEQPRAVLWKNRQFTAGPSVVLSPLP
jgi:hypothetical protein